MFKLYHNKTQIENFIIFLIVTLVTGFGWALSIYLKRAGIISECEFFNCNFIYDYLPIGLLFLAFSFFLLSLKKYKKIKKEEWIKSPKWLIFVLILTIILSISSYISQIYALGYYPYRSVVVWPFVFIFSAFITIISISMIINLIQKKENIKIIEWLLG